MKVGIAYATPGKQSWITVEVPEGTTVQTVIDTSGILAQFPEIDLETQKVGIFGKPVLLETVVEDGARVEIYRPITADPKTVRRRAKPGGSDDDDD